MPAGRPGLQQQSGDNALARILNKIRAELKRLGNITSGGGIDVKSTAAGINISARIPPETRRVFGVLQDDLQPNMAAYCLFYKWDKTGQNVMIGDEKVKVYASPLITEKLNKNDIVECAQFAEYDDTWYVVNSWCKEEE